MSLNLLLLGIELYVLSAVVIIQHRLRSRYGLTWLLIFLGGLIAAVHMSAPLGIYVQSIQDINFTVPSNVLVPVILLAILLIYVTEGTAPARLAIWGVVVVIVLLLLVRTSLPNHLALPGGGNFKGLTVDAPVLQVATRKMAASMITFVIDMYAMAIFFQFVINRFGLSDRFMVWDAPPKSRVPIWLATLAALNGALWVDALLFTLLTYAGTPNFANILHEQLFGKTVSGILLWPLASVYLYRCVSALPDFRRIARRSSVDVLFGGYGRLENELVRSEESLLRRMDELSAIHSISLDMTMPGDLDKLFEKIVESAAQILAAPFGGLYMCDAEKEEVRCMVCYQTPSDYTGIVLQYGEGVAGIVAESGEPLIINDYQNYSNRAAVFDDGQFTAAISAPLIWHGNVTGVLHVLDNVEDRKFAEEELELLSLFANQAAVALENARLLVETNQSLDREKKLTDIARSLSSGLDLPTMLRDVVRLTAELIGADAGALALLDSDGETVRFPYLFNLPSSLSEQPLPDPLGVTRKVIRSGDSVLLRNYSEYPEAIAEWIEAGVCNVVGVPICSGEKAIGGLGLMSLSPENQFSERDLLLAESVGRQAGIAIQSTLLFEETQRQMKELGAVFDASLDTSSVLEVDILLDRIYKQVEKLFAPDSFAVVRYDPDDDHLQVLLAIEENQKLPEWIGAKFALGDGGLTGWVIQNRQHLIIKDIETDPLPIEPKHSGRPSCSWMGVPLLAHEQVLGAISVQSFQPNMYDQSHCRLLETLASQIAIALENADYATELERNLAEMSALYDLAQKTTSSLETDEVLVTIVENLRDMLSARAATIVLLDPKTQMLSLGATAGVAPQWVREFSLMVGEGVSGKVVETGEPSYVPDTYADPDFKFFSREVRSLMVVPLKAKDSIIGALSIDSDKPNSFTTRDEHLLTIAASQVTVAIENAQLYSKVQKLAVTDSLTQVANRRAFDAALESEVVRATRYGHPLSLIFMDIDDFKIFNDTYGHPAGDVQLREIAEILQRNVRLPDMVARYGGEEFVLLLPHTGKQGACYLAERIRIAAESKALDLMPKTKTMRKSDGSISGYTLSIGVASVPNDAQSPKGLLHAADAGVLEAKRAGKNRVCAA